MKPGSIVTKDKYGLGIVGWHNPARVKADGVRVMFETGASAVYEELTEVTEFTPAMTSQLIRLIARSQFAVNGKDMGMTGTDPEIFAFTHEGAVIPAWEWLKDRTESPEVYWDGVQAEFNTGPTSCHSYQTDAVRNKLKMTLELLRRHDPKAYLATKDVVKLDRKTLLTADDRYIELGCSPSGNAYPEVQPINILDPRSHPFRYSGCHLHMSVLDYEMPEWFPHGTVAMIDKVAGVMLTALGRGMEDPKRREAYGRAGEFRVPAKVEASTLPTQWKDKYWTRLEYRTPGSFLLHHPALFNFAADVTRAAFRMGLIMDGRKLEDIGDVQGIINNCDADAAVKLITAKGSFHQKVLDGLGGSYNSASKTLAILTKGAQHFSDFQTPLEANWKLSVDWNNDNYNNGRTRWQNISGV